MIVGGEHMSIALGIGFFSLAAVIGLVFAVILHVRHGVGTKSKARRAAKKKR